MPRPPAILSADRRCPSLGRFSGSKPDGVGTGANRGLNLANSGIGFETAGAPVRKGTHVVLACRIREKADGALVRITGEAGHGTSEILEIDLADLESVSGAGESFLSSHGRLDVLVNNAGAMATPKLCTAQGLEMHFGVNHLGHFALTGLSLPLLLESGAVRVVCVSGQGRRARRVDFDNLNGERRSSSSSAYFQRKLANLLCVRELHVGPGAAGTDVIAAAAHPGDSRTGLPGGFFEQGGHPVEVRASLRARGDVTARRLWGGL